MMVIRYAIGISWFLICGICGADGNDDHRARLLFTSFGGDDLQEQQQIRIEAQQTPLTVVLEEITEKTDIPIHHAISSEILITAVCQGDHIREILQCLLGPNANLVLRHQTEIVEGITQKRIVESWVLASAPPPRSMAANPVDGIEEDDRIEDYQEDADLVKMAAAEDPVARAQAISRLITDAHTPENIILYILETALLDQNAQVRVQAVYGLSRYGMTARFADILQDGDSSVRLMAVETMGNDIGTSPLNPLSTNGEETDSVKFLRQALEDRDETVSTLAALKLKSLGINQP